MFKSAVSFGVSVLFSNFQQSTEVVGTSSVIFENHDRDIFGNFWKLLEHFLKYR